MPVSPGAKKRFGLRWTTRMVQNKNSQETLHLEKAGGKVINKNKNTSPPAYPVS